MKPKSRPLTPLQWLSQGTASTAEETRGILCCGWLAARRGLSAWLVNILISQLDALILKKTGLRSTSGWSREGRFLTPALVSAKLYRIFGITTSQSNLADTDQQGQNLGWRD